MKRKVIIKKAIAVAVTMSLMTCLVPNGSITVNAASKKSMLSKTKISVNVGKKKTVKLKKAKYKVVWKIISGKKNISIKKKGKYKQIIKIKGKKIGKAKIKAVYGKKKYILKVTVKGNNKENISKNVETPKNIETTSKTTVQTTEKASTVSTTEARVTTVPTTVAPTTVASTTVMPTTMAPTTVVPTTVTPTTVMPTTMAPTTVVPTTVAPATVTPTTAPIIPDMEVDENIKAPEGLVWAGNKELPYYFAWAKASDVDSYNVYVDGKCIKNVVDGAVNLDASVFEKGSGEYTISVAAVKGNKVSVATSLKYTFSPDGQLVTTESEKVTNKPTDATTVKTTTTVMPTTIAPTAPSQEVDENIKAPEGLVWAGNKELPYYFAWAATDGADSYNVYVDNKYVTNVKESSVNLDKSVFEKGSGEYTISVAAVKGNKKSNSTSIKYTYNKEGQQVTTVAPTEKITEDTTTTKKEFYEEPETEVHPKNINVDNYMKQIDTSSSTSIKTSANEGIEKLFDGDINTKLCTSDGFPLRISWQMKKPIILKKYTLTTANDSEAYSYRNPKSWHLYGSNNGTSWTQIDTVTDSGIEAKNLKAYTYETDIQESYQYYLIQFEGNGTIYYGFQLAEISLNGDVADVDKEMGEDLSSYYDSIFASATTAKGNGNEAPFNLFDGSKESKLFEFSNKFSIAWKMKQDTTLYSYSLTTANDNETYKGRNPKSWILYGSSDGTNWEKIDTVNNSGMEDVNFKTYNYTVDKVGSYRYYKLDVKAGYGSSVQLSEISLKGAYISPSKYDILFTGDWKDVTVDGYLEELTKLFYNSYPRLYQRWGNGTEPTTITFKADKNYDGVAYCQGTTVCVSTKYANSHPNDIGFFSHEITHSVQQYSGKLNYGDDVAWWTENMANYGGFRYFHWSNPKYVQVYEATDTSLQDWGYEQYGNNKWFFAYMDSKYPTRKNADGTLKYGLIDSINKLIKDNNTGSTYTDDPYNTTTPFNKVVKQITGYDCIESLRKRYVEELQQGTWTFKGFANYEDNWLTENIDGIPNPEYPMVGEKLHGNKTATQLNNTVTEGTNLCLGGKVYDCSGYTNDNENAQKLIDGDLNTKWCATSSNVTNGEYKLNGVKHWVKIDLGKEKEFNTYTLYNTRSKEGYGNTTEWEVLVSNDGNKWTSVDYQPSNNSAVSSFNIGNQKARYIMIKIFTPDNGVGTLRLYDFQLFNIK